MIACLSEPVPQPADLLLSDGGFHLVVPVLLLSLLAVAPLAWLTRQRYRRWVMRLMSLDQKAEAPAALREAATAAPPAAWAPADGAAGTLAHTLAQGERRVWLATLAAWAVFGGMGLWVAGLGEPVTLGQRLAFAAAAALLALGPLMTQLPDRGARQAHRAGAVAALLALLLLWWMDAQSPPAPAAGAAGDDDPTVTESVLTAACLAFGYWAMFDRRLRGQVQPLVVLVSVAALAVLLPYGWLEQHAGSCLARVDQATEAGRQLPMNLMTVAMMSLGAVAVWLGFRAVAGLVWLIEQRHLSESALGGALCLALLAVTLVYQRAPDDAEAVRSAHLLAAPLWLAASFGAQWLALAGLPGRRRGDGPGPRLLVLRVFSADPRKHALLDSVQARWRFVGPVLQIGGPDLVAMNVDPYEASMYLSARMHRLFLPTVVGGAALQAQLDARPCGDGRHRIHEVFCFNTAWRQSVEQLMLDADAIVLDVRGLNAQREGTSYEIGRLAVRGLLPRVVAVGDADTDWPHVDDMLRRHGGDPARLPRIGDARDGGVDDLLARLIAAASAPGIPHTIREALPAQ